MNLIKINLLPYREWQEQKRKREFQFILIAGGILGVVLCALIYISLAAAIERQNGRNASLESGIKALDEEIKEIHSLEEQRKNFLERKKKIEELDNKRFEAARIIDTLDQLVPEGAYLISIKAGDSNNTAITNSHTIVGKAISDNKVAIFMTALPSTGVFDAPQLDNIKKTDDGQEFTVKANLLETKIEDVYSRNSSSQVGSAPAMNNATSPAVQTSSSPAQTGGN